MVFEESRKLIIETFRSNICSQTSIIRPLSETDRKLFDHKNVEILPSSKKLLTCKIYGYQTLPFPSMAVYKENSEEKDEGSGLLVAPL